MRSGRSGGARCAIAVLILAVAMTPTTAGAHGPPSPETYRWVNAPTGIESAGTAEPATASYPADMFSGGFSTAWTPDGQASVLLTVPDGDSPSNTKVTLQPLDADSLEHAPADL